MKYLVKGLLIYPIIEQNYKVDNLQITILIKVKGYRHFCNQSIYTTMPAADIHRCCTAMVHEGLFVLR